MNKLLLWLFFFAVSLALSSCQDKTNHTTLIEKERTKPLVTLIPIVDKSGANLPWDLSEELTSSIQHKLLQKNKISLFEHIPTKQLQKKITRNLFSFDVQWCKSAFKEHEFVVFIQLIEHSEKKNEVNICCQLRVIDVRGDTAKIILQEVIEESHAIPKQFAKSTLDPKKQNFNISPLGLAHAQLTKQIAGRIEDYILLSKNR